MFDSLKKKLQSGIKKLSKQVAEKQPLASFEKEEQFLHEKEIPTEEYLKKEPDLIEKQEEKEEHFEEEQSIPRKRYPELKKEKLEEREEKEAPPSLEDKILRKEERLEKKGFLKKIRSFPSSMTEKTLSGSDIDDFFAENEADLLYSNVAVEVVEFFKSSLKKQVVDKKIKRGQTEEFLKGAFRQSLLEIVDQGEVVFEKVLQRERPSTILFLGFNGAGKTTTIAKVASYLQSRKYSVVLAAGDTFRAASIEQLEHHAKKLKVKVIKHQYGGDSAAVIFDAKKHAQANDIDFVLADTAGRTHVDKNLLDELKKVVRVNKPSLKVLVVDSLTGNDAVEQAKLFNEAISVDAVVLTKLDVNKKGGSLLSVCYAIKKPILFLGTGQEYGDLQVFEPQKFVDEIVG